MRRPMHLHKAAKEEQAQKNTQNHLLLFCQVMHGRQYSAGCRFHNRRSSAFAGPALAQGGSLRLRAAMQLLYDGFRPGMDVQFVVDSADIAAHAVHGNAQSVGDFLVGIAVG